MKVLAGGAWKTFTALIDSGAKDNFVSRLVAKECDLQLTGERPKTFQTLPRNEGIIYDTALAQVEITNTLGQTKVDALRLRVIDMPGVDLILG
ncbi:MAG: hypothetical protein CL912_25460 [Deltaproteobacteria bacterium]|nr:hypothetical protein [Deltaproteobacteria bacterium]